MTTWLSFIPQLAAYLTVSFPYKIKYFKIRPNIRPLPPNVLFVGQRYSSAKYQGDLTKIWRIIDTT